MFSGGNVRPGTATFVREHGAPGSYVFASTTGRAVSPRSGGALNSSVRCLHRPDTSFG
jgi:hypothetical protein